MVEAVKQAQQGEVEALVQVQETLHRTTSVASELEARLGATCVAQEESQAIAKRVQFVSEQAIKETKMLPAMQQATAAELKQQVSEIGLQIQEQSQRTLL